MIIYSIRGNRQLVEQIHYNFLFRWFLGMALDEKIWDHSSVLGGLLDSCGRVGGVSSAECTLIFLRGRARGRPCNRAFLQVDVALLKDDNMAISVACHAKPARAHSWRQ
jgi:hypothetical protein